MRHCLRACMDDTESSDKLNVPVYLLLQSRGSDMYAGTFLHITIEMYPNCQYLLYSGYHVYLYNY